MSTYSSVNGLPEEWDVATSPWEEPLRLSYQRDYRADGGFVRVVDCIYLDRDAAEAVCRQLAAALNWTVAEPKGGDDD